MMEPINQSINVAEEEADFFSSGSSDEYSDNTVEIRHLIRKDYKKNKKLHQQQHMEDDERLLSCKSIMKQLIAMLLIIITVVTLISISLYAYINERIEHHKDDIMFILLGDFGRNGNYKQTDVALQMDKHCSAKMTFNLGCKFILGSGDNFYPNGVSSSDDQQFNSSFESIYGTLDTLKHVKWYQIVGNHDYHRNPHAQLQYKSSRWTMPNLFYTTYHRTNTFKMTIIHLDTTPFTPFKEHKLNKTAYDLGRKTLNEQLTMLENIISNHNPMEGWLFIVGHHPIFSATNIDNFNGYDKHMAPIQAIILKYNYKIDAYFNGHSHSVHNLRLGEFYYFTSGGGSKTLKDKYKPAEYQEKLKSYLHNFLLIHYQEQAGFIRFHISHHEMIALFVNYDGKVTSLQRISKNT